MDVVGLTHDFSKLNGKENQCITKPVPLDAETGEVLVRTSTGKGKVRKGQSEEEYQKQLHEFWDLEKGPAIQSIDWMDKTTIDEVLKWEHFDLSIKHTRLVLIGFATRLYYLKQYKECSILVERLEELFKPFNNKNKIVKEIKELQSIAELCTEHLK